MTYEDFVVELKKLEFPTAYHHWPVDKVPTLPYVLHLKSGRGDFKADNINYKKRENVTIEFYTQYPDFKNETKIENMLDTLGIEYERTEPMYLEAEDMYQTLFDFYI